MSGEVETPDEPVAKDARGTQERGTDRKGVESAEMDKIPLTKTSMTMDPPKTERTPPLVLDTTDKATVKQLDVFVLHGATLDPDIEIAAASRIWSQCGIRFEVATRHTFDEKETRRLIAVTAEDNKKKTSELRVEVDIDKATKSMENLRQAWFSNRAGDYGVFFAPIVILTINGAPSSIDPKHKIVYIGRRQFWEGFDLAHELGHQLIDPQAPHGVFESSLMRPGRPGNKIDPLECRAAKGDHRAKFQITKRYQ